MKNTRKLNFVLKFRLAGDSRLHVKGAARIRIDGQGLLVFDNFRSGRPETIRLGELQTFYIHPVKCVLGETPVLAA